jgi:hypothetical protein
MQVSKTFNLAALAAAFIMVLSSAVYAGDRGGRNGGRDGGHSENSCADGNEPVPGANCTNWR